jgi:hypothetical protein
VGQLSGVNFYFECTHFHGGGTRRQAPIDSCIPVRHIRNHLMETGGPERDDDSVWRLDDVNSTPCDSIRRDTRAVSATRGGGVEPEARYSAPPRRRERRPARHDPWTGASAAGRTFTTRRVMAAPTTHGAGTGSTPRRRPPGGSPGPSRGPAQVLPGTRAGGPSGPCLHRCLPERVGLPHLSWQYLRRASPARAARGHPTTFKVGPSWADEKESGRF